MTEAANSDTSETRATLEIKDKIKNKKPYQIIEEQKGNPPSEELLTHLPYIRKNPCITRVMVAIHQLKYKITKLSSCSEKQKCTFCKYHVEEMMKEKYNEPPSTTQAPTQDTAQIETSAKPKTKSLAKTPDTSTVCNEVNVVFLLYCINCDEVLLGYTCEKLKLLVDFSFGFHRDERCEAGKSHEKRYVRCMMIDRLELTYGANYVVPISLLIYTNHPSIMGRFIIENKEKFSVFVIKESEFTKGNIKCETPPKLITWEKYLQVKKYLRVEKYKRDKSYLQKESCFLSPPSINVDGNSGLYRQYHYLPSSNIKELGPKPHIYSFDFENIVYLKICYNCNIKYVGRAEKTFLDRYSSVLSSKCTPAVLQHFNGKNECTVRDYRWTVIDGLSDDQIYLLEKWRYVFNKCELHVQKKIWEMMDCDMNSLNKDLLEIVWQNDSIEDIRKRIKEMEQLKLSLQNETTNKELDRALEHINSANDDVETFLRGENEKWIKKTKDLFIEEWEDYWMTELETLENGLNVIKSSKSKDTSPHFYNEFFKSLSKKLLHFN